MELLINQVGYQCDGEKIALLQSDTNLDIRGHLRLLRQDDERILLEIPLQPAGQVEGWLGATTGAPNSLHSRSPATTGWRPSSKRAPRSASCAPPLCHRPGSAGQPLPLRCHSLLQGAARQRRLRSGRPQRPPVWQRPAQRRARRLV